MTPAAEAPEALVRDFLEWIAAEPRAYCQVMETWRTNCPRLTVWEDALDEGFVRRGRLESGESSVELTTHGRAFLAGGTVAP